MNFLFRPRSEGHLSSRGCHTCDPHSDKWNAFIFFLFTPHSLRADSIQTPQLRFWPFLKKKKKKKKFSFIEIPSNCRIREFDEIFRSTKKKNDENNDTQWTVSGRRQNELVC